MSHVIPIVSSSPPPLDDDDDTGQGWNDEDDEFGNFTSAPHVPLEISSNFDINSSKSDVSLPEDHFTSDKVEGESNVNQKTLSSESSSSVENYHKDSLNIADSYVEKDNVLIVDENNKNEFVDFAQFDDPTEANLPPEEPVHKQPADCSENDYRDSNTVTHFSQLADKLTEEHDSSLALTNNESVYSNTSTIDSGVFSTDLSPCAQTTSVLCQSSEFPEKQGVLLDTPECTSDGTSTVHIDTEELKTELGASDDWSDFNSGFDNDAQQNGDLNEDTHIGGTCVQVGDGEETHSTSFKDIQNSQSSPSTAAFDLEHNSLEGNEVPDSQAIIEAQQISLDINKSETGTSSKADDGEHGKFDNKVSEIVNKEDPVSQKEINEPSPMQQCSDGDVDKGGQSREVLDLSNSSIDENGIISDTVKLCHVGENQMNNEDVTEEKTSDGGVPDEVEDGDGFGSFSVDFDKRDIDPHEEVEPVTFRTSVFDSEEENASTGDGFIFSKPVEYVDPRQEGEEEFGDFGGARQGQESEDDDFGDFGTVAGVKVEDYHPESSDVVKQEDDTEWADFAEPSLKQTAESADDHVSTENQVSTSTPVNESKSRKLVKAIIECFPAALVFEEPAKINQEDSHVNDEEHRTVSDAANLTTLNTVVDLGLSNPLEAKQQSWTVVQHPSKKDPKVKMWSNLKDVDSSPALQYSWSASHCSREVYLTLHIDTQNVLFTQKKQAVPFFTSGLSILEPIRGGSDQKNSRHIISPTSLVDTNRSEQPQNITSVQDIPPVDFDWSSSGLTNPLTDEWDWVFKADCQESTRSSLQPLEDILKKNKPTAKLATYETLSPEALRILEKMPDLSFMHSRVLMFPVKQ